jgi:hypothetical protein
MGRNMTYTFAPDLGKIVANLTESENKVKN